MLASHVLLEASTVALVYGIPSAKSICNVDGRPNESTNILSGRRRMLLLRKGQIVIMPGRGNDCLNRDHCLDEGMALLVSLGESTLGEGASKEHIQNRKIHRKPTNARQSTATT